MNSTKSAHELQKGNWRAEQGDLKEKDPRRSTSDPLYYRCATLITRKFTMVQALGFGYASLGESESYPMNGNMSVKWRA